MKSVKECISEAIVKHNIKNVNSNNPNDVIDLDLPSGLKWATCNIGADKPEEPGLLFQWGRTDGYKYGDNNHNFLNEYNYSATSGKKYNKGDVLNKEDDAAYVNTNGKLRMPTVEEIDELLENTTNEFTTLNEVKGRKFISKKDTDNWIFIPASGYYANYKEMFEHYANYCCILSSTSCSNENNKAYSITFKRILCKRFVSNMLSGCSVRGVCK